MGFKFQGVDFLHLDASFSEDELLVRRTARDFVEDNLVPIIEECFRTEVPHVVVCDRYRVESAIGKNFGHRRRLPHPATADDPCVSLEAARSASQA